MDGHNGLCAHSGISLSLKTAEILTHSTTRMKLEDRTLSEISHHTERTPTLWSHFCEVLRAVRNHRDTKSDGGSQGLGARGMG